MSRAPRRLCALASHPRFNGQVLRIVYILAAIILLGLVMLGTALWRNQVILFEPPGVAERLKTYLTTNTARTAPNALMPELRPPHYAASVAELATAACDACNALGWDTRAQANGCRAVVKTALLGFSDDVTIVAQQAPGGAWLDIVSRSRVGKADFGANARHISLLLETLDATVPRANAEGG